MKASADILCPSLPGVYLADVLCLLQSRKPWPQCPCGKEVRGVQRNIASRHLAA